MEGQWYNLLPLQPTTPSPSASSPSTEEQAKGRFYDTSGETTYRTSKMDHTSKELDDMGANFFLWTVLIKGHRRQRKKNETRH